MTVRRKPPPRVEHREIGLSGISVRRDGLKPELVEALAKSMRRIGLLHPIILRPAAVGYYLVAGKHRYFAAVKLKWQSIPARIFFDLTEADARAIATDENLIRGEPDRGLEPTAESAITTRYADDDD